MSTLDVRPDFRAGLHPREKIQAALSGLDTGETLRLLVQFEPVPLLHWAAGQGLAYKTSRTAEGDWEVLFTRGSAAQPQPAAVTAPTTGNPRRSSAMETVELDARGLEPPQPLMRILEAVVLLPRGARLRARTDRRPVHLYSPLEERGFVGQSEEQPDGSFITHIEHA